MHNSLARQGQKLEVQWSQPPSNMGSCLPLGGLVFLSWEDPGWSDLLPLSPGTLGLSSSAPPLCKSSVVSKTGPAYR